MMKKPGIMLYFELMPCLQRLDDAQKGRLLWGMLAYGRDGEEPDFDSDEALAMAWPFVRLRLDQDEERYLKKVEQRHQAAVSRWQKKEQYYYQPNEEESL